MVIAYTKSGPVALTGDDARILIEDRRRLVSENEALKEMIGRIIKEEKIMERYALKNIEKLECHLKKARKQRDIERQTAETIRSLFIKVISGIGI